MAVRRKDSAGLLLFRGQGKSDLEVLLIHPGGPFWTRRDDGAWSIPKGMIGEGEEPLVAAQREFTEETGHRPQGEAVALGAIKQPGGKWVRVWALAGDWDPSLLRSNTFAMEWPPRSGKMQSFPEADRAAWFGLAEARRKILKGQSGFLDRLEELLATVT